MSADDPHDGASGGILARAIARPVTVAAAVMLTVLFGVLATVALPVQLTPDVSVPTVSVTTRWPGAAPVEVETEVLDEQEEVLKRTQGLVRMESTASLNQAEITLEFEVGTDLEQALVRVTNRLSQVPRYPEGADQPIVSTSNATGPPLAVILVRHDEGATVGPYRTWVEEEIVPQIERVGGVAGVFMRGGRTSEVHVSVDAHALAARGLTVPFVAERLRAEIRNVSAGEVDIGKRRLVVRTKVTADTVAELSRLVLKVGPDREPVRLADVGTVSVGLRRASDFAIGDDRDAIAILPRREAGSNVLEVTEALKRVVADLDQQRFAPEGLAMEVVDDQTGYIYAALDRVRLNLGLGALLATVILLVFLRSAAASAIVALAIPLCVLATAVGMSLFGRSVNVISLAGVTFAVGMVVDNSIVALENIVTWRDRRPDVREATLRAIREVWGALLASTATTAAVFLPILAWEGEVGELLRDIALAIAVAVVASFFVSVLVIPSFAAVGLRPRAEAPRPTRFTRAGSAVREGIARGAAWVSARTRRAGLTVGLTVAGAIAIAVALLPSMEYLPTGNRNLIFGIVLPPPGYGIEELRRTGYENQKVMRQHTGVARDGVPAVRRSFFVGDPKRLFIGGVAEDETQVKELRDFMRGLHAKIPGTIGFATQAALFSRGIGEGRAVEVELSGRDLDTLIGAGRALFAELRKVVPGAQVRPVPLLDYGAPEIHVVPNRAQAAALGFSARDVALVADTYVDGAILGEFGREGERKLDLVLRADGGGDDGPRGSSASDTPITDDRSLRQAPVATPAGTTVPFEVIGDLRPALGPTVIQRIERRRAVVLQVTPPDDVPFEAAIDAVRGHVAEKRAAGTLPVGVDVALGGSAGKLVASQRQFAGVLAIALVILFLLLAALFEDFVAPVVVLVAIPLAAAGGVAALAGVNALGSTQPLDLVSALGFLILIGVVVNNAILIVDGALLRLREGASLTPAITEAVRARVRPIFMSTLTSLAGLAPMVVASGSGSELYRGIGTIVLGGLASATVLSLVVVPAFFSLLWRLRGHT
ncbi:MAG: efflux RND transporter permease subunit [Myxococcota bacterium]